MPDQRNIGEPERRLLTLINQLPDAIVRFDLFGRLVYMNQTAPELIGVPAAQLLGKAVLEAAHTSNHAASRWLASLLQAAIDEGIPNCTEVTWRDARRCHAHL